MINHNNINDITAKNDKQNEYKKSICINLYTWIVLYIYMFKKNKQND